MFEIQNKMSKYIVKNSLVIGIMLSFVSVVSGQSTIIVDNTKTYQTITGWEATIYAKDWPGHSVTFPAYMDELADLAVNDLGINRVRLEITPGAENPIDYGGQYLNGQIDEGQYIHTPGYASQIINDNNDPSVINWNGFHFSFLDHKISNIVLPLKQRVEANGEKLYINLTFVNFNTVAGSNITFYDNPDEYAEFMLVVFEHMNNTYGFVPDAIEIILEPDNASGWNAYRIPNALVAAAQRLEANGYTPTPDFIAPSTTAMDRAVTYFDQMISNQEVLNYLTELSYHRYYGVSDADLQAIANRGVQYNINTSMLEWWSSGNSYQILHKDLKMGRNSAWQQGALLGGASTDLYNLDETDLANPIITIKDKTKFTRQYFKFIRSGAIRIEATSNNPAFDPLGFINADGTYVVVVKATAGGNFSVQSLPAGTYGIKYTTSPSVWDVDLADVTITSGEVLNTNIPAAGVITIYSKSSITETISSPTSISGQSGTYVNKTESYTANGASSSLGHNLEYRFDWGDGTISGWGSITQSHQWSNNGTFNIKSQARCASHTGKISAWSSNLKTVTVNYLTLSSSVSPGGAGTVTKNPNKSGYTYNEPVQITANASTGYTFSQWSGDATGSSNPNTITMDSNKSVTANFTAISNPETISSPTSISGPSSTYVDKAESYTASGASSNLGHSLQYRFDWGNGTISSWGSPTRSYQWNNSGTFNIKSQARCASHISEISAWSGTLRTVIVSYLTLSTNVNPGGAGSVTKNPNKLEYTYNESVQLTANPTTGYTFSYWSGGASGSSNPTSILMNSNKTVTANFIGDATPPTTSGHIPAKYPDLHSEQAARDTIIQLNISDSGSGVAYESVTIEVEGNLIYDGDYENPVGVYDSTSKTQTVKGICRRVGTESSYTFIFQPSILFDYEQKVDVKINATDQAGNIMPEENYHFYTVMRTFGENVRVNSDTGTLAQNNPATARDSSDNIWIVWDQMTAAGDTDIYIGKLPANGSAFTSSVPVISSANNQSKPAIAIDSNKKIYVVWQADAPNGHWDIFVSTSTNGTSWASPVKVSSNDTNNENDQTTPAIAIDSNNKAYVTWEDNSKGDSDKDIWVATSTGGITWDTPTFIASASGNQTEPDIAANSANTIYIVWTDERSTSRTDIYGAASNDGPWTNLPIVNNSNNQTSPVIAAESTGTILHLLWVDDTPGDNDIYYATSNVLPGSPLTGISIIDEPDTNQSFPSIVVEGTKVFACWQDYRHVANNADTDIFYAEKTDSKFGTNILVNDDIGNYTQTSPVIGTDNNGNPYIVWVDNRRGNNDIYFAGAMSVGPALATSTVDADSGGTVAYNSSLKVDIPAGALDADTTIAIAEMVNPPEPPSDVIGVLYEFSPGGLQFNTPVTITLPHSSSQCPGYSIYRVYWYNAETGLWSQSGITNVQHKVLSSTLHAVQCQSTHFTGFGTGGSIGSGGGIVGGGGGGGGGGCSVSAGGEGNIIEFILPYIGFFVVLAVLTVLDSRVRKIQNKTSEK